MTLEEESMICPSSEAGPSSAVPGWGGGGGGGGDILGFPSSSSSSSMAMTPGEEADFLALFSSSFETSSSFGGKGLNVA